MKHNLNIYLKGIIKEDYYSTKVLQRAGLSIVSNIEETTCAILEIQDDINSFEKDLTELKQLVTTNEIKKIFIWNKKLKLSIDFKKIINSNLDESTLNFKSSSAIKFVEDVRYILENLSLDEVNTELKDLCIVYNSLEEIAAKKCINLLSEILGVVGLGYDQSTDIDFYKTVKNLKNNTKFIVLFYQEQNQWVENFLPELWKLTGGASCTVPILVINDDVNSLVKNDNLQNINFVNVHLDMIPLEIKMQFDKFYYER